MKALLALAIAVYTVPSLSWSATEATRSLPRGEDDPMVIDAVFSSPAGEVQFVAKRKEVAHSAFLRDFKGSLLGLQAVEGPEHCGSWVISNKQEPLPEGCSFVFRDDFVDGSYSVRSEEMQEASLFQLVKGKMRDVAL